MHHLDTQPVRHPGIAITIDHRSGRRCEGAPVDAMRRVERRRPTAARPNYGARRVGALGVLVLAVLVSVKVVAAAGSLFESTPAFADAGVTSTIELTASPSTGPTHVADAGDTLWSIAETHRGDVARSDFIDALVELNGDTAIEVGQAVRLPRT